MYYLIFYSSSPNELTFIVLVVQNPNQRIVHCIKHSCCSGVLCFYFDKNDLAQMVIDIVPSVEVVRMVNSGTEACLSALRVMRAYTGKEKVQ